MKRIVKLVCLFITAILLLTVVRFPAAMAESGQGMQENGDRLEKAVVLYVGSPIALVNNSETLIDEANPETQPVMSGNSVLVPIRFISEALGAKVDYDGNSREVTINYDGYHVSLFPESISMKVNDKNVQLEVPAQIIGNRTFIPLRRVSEALGKSVFYDRGLIIICDNENIYDRVKEKTAIDQIISRVNNLPVLGNAENFKNLLQQVQFTGGDMKKALANALPVDGSRISNSAAQAQVPGMDINSKDQAALDYSTTNVQVEGVDEADVVKTDGLYIYQVNGNQIVIAKVYPADTMKVVNRLEFADSGFSPKEILLDGSRLVVIGETYTNVPVYSNTDKKKINVYPPSFGQNTVKAIVYDITDRSSIKQLKEVELEGNYVSSRKIGSVIYLISNDRVDYYRIQNGEINDTPSYRDTTAGDSFINVDYKDIRYIPGFVEPNYMTIAAIDLEKTGETAKISIYLGAGDNIYASLQNLYIAFTKYSGGTVNPQAAGTVPSLRPAIAPMNKAVTAVYKFSLADSQVTFLASGEVPGTLLNQFSMDEYGNYFRIATTGRDYSSRGIGVSTNNLYVLDETMNMAGKIEDIAPGENIYSVRFVGDRAYMVTFKTVDPLFAIDLKNPEKPAILGSLKIPGYSNYLQPYDENHIIGFGKDTVEISVGNTGITGSDATMAFYQGIKVALFDVTDVNNPKQMYTVNIGDRGTDSELLYNHKALLFSKDRNLLAFPVTVAEVDKTQSKGNLKNIPQYGQFVYQGAYVYNIDLQKGFTLKGRITHISEEEYGKSGNVWYDSNRNVKRILYIDNTLFTLSDSMIKANDMNSMQETGSLALR